MLLTDWLSNTVLMDRVLTGLDRLWFCETGRALRGAAGQAADLVAPSWCLGCSTEGPALCERCYLDFRQLAEQPYRAEEAAAALPVVGLREEAVEVLPVMAAVPYTTFTAELIVAFKDHERVGLRRVLAAALGRAVAAGCAELLPDGGVLVWPPPSLRSMLRRGRHPLGELVSTMTLPAGVASLELKAPAGGVAALLSARFTQKARGAAARRRAAAGVQLTPQTAADLSGTEVLLVDDVLTTGSTLRGLYEVLHTAGARVRGAAVLAATPEGAG